MGLFDKKTKSQEGLTGSFKVANKPVVCTHCGSENHILKGDVLLNTVGMSFLGWDWANKSAKVLICTTCTKLEWFITPPELVQ